MRKSAIAILITILSMPLVTVSISAANQQPIPNQNNVSTRADETLKNPKDLKTRRSGASKHARLRKERDARHKITVLQNRPSTNTTQQ